MSKLIRSIEAASSRAAPLVVILTALGVGLLLNASSDSDPAATVPPGYVTPMPEPEDEDVTTTTAPHPSTLALDPDPVCSTVLGAINKLKAARSPPQTADPPCHHEIPGAPPDLSWARPAS